MFSIFIYLFFKAPLLINSLHFKSFSFLCGEGGKKNHLPFNGVSSLFPKPSKRLSLLHMDKSFLQNQWKACFQGNSWADGNLEKLISPFCKVAVGGKRALRLTIFTWKKGLAGSSHVLNNRRAVRRAGHLGTTVGVRAHGRAYSN